MRKRITYWLGGDETYNRELGVCFVGDFDVAATVIAVGLGRDCPTLPWQALSSLRSEYCFTD